MRHFITGVLVFLCGFLAYINYKKSKIDEKENLLILEQLQDERDSAYLTIEYVTQQRDSAYTVSDSLITVSQVISTKLDQTEQKLKSIKGSFNHLNNKELELKMEDEWRKGN